MVPPQLTNLGIHQDNGSMYTLATVGDSNDHEPLLTPQTPSYGATFPRSPSVPQSPKRLILNATIKMAAIFIISTAFLSATLWLALPELDEVDRPDLKIPKSFAQLQALNTLLKKYRNIFPYRILICYVTTYLFLQAFSLPGSMYLSILGGALYGVPRALPLACCCVASGATLCYWISAALGPVLLTFPKYRLMLQRFSTSLSAHRHNLISYLIVVRIAPLPPHWVVNIICPHVGIGLGTFWVSTALGIFGVSVIHTTIGEGLDNMTSADDFHLISWKNFFGLAAVVVGVLIPVGLRYWFGAGQDVAGLGGAEGESEEDDEDRDAQTTGLGLRFDDEDDQSSSSQDRILASGPPLAVNKPRNGGQYSDDEDYEDEDDDLILESGPALSSTKVASGSTVAK